MVYLRRLPSWLRAWARPAACLVPAVIGVVLLVPSWWRGVLAAVIAPGWRWLPILMIAGGVIGFGVQVARRAPGDSAPARPDRHAVRLPLFTHVLMLLLLAATAAACLGLAMWAILGRPDLAVAGAPAPGGPAATVWSVQNTFDAVKIVLAMVAGIGGVVGLTVAYRKQGHGEAAERRENIKLFNERFGKAAELFGSDKAAVRLAAVYAMAGLADDWTEGRQTCVDVLCAYYRKPYRAAAPDGGEQEAAEEKQVRRAIISVIRYRLRTTDPYGRPRWHGHYFNLRGATVDDANLSDITVSAGTTLNFDGARFTSGEASFARMTASGGTIVFRRADFSGAEVTFSGARFTGSAVSFDAAEFSGGTVSFRSAVFDGGTVAFDRARFDGAAVSFDGAEFTGGTVDLSRPGRWDRVPAGIAGSPPGVLRPSQEHLRAIGSPVR